MLMLSLPQKVFEMIYSNAEAGGRSAGDAASADAAHRALGERLPARSLGDQAAVSRADDSR